MFQSTWTPVCLWPPTQAGQNPHFAAALKSRYTDLPYSSVTIAPVVEASGLRVRVPGHKLRDFDPSAVRQVVRNARGAERG
jgi:hypothetical protein